eukprot:TRINITY_DN11327_c0_g1_i1.p1 TRINITY_DN11327_c0_g1~~TRINITY_DN11327_c0_g1_i1.p1  ORF type:complete len:908 (+),score=203.67 TRINITY_DN11327_c0_g1_i1:76-2799(+)
MVKSYLRFDADGSLGVVCSNNSNALFDCFGRLAICPVLESVCLWDLRRNTVTKTMTGGKSEVTALARSQDGKLIASGHQDGSIIVWDANQGKLKSKLNGHKNAVTCMRFNASSSLLASGSKDTDVIVWDVIAEKGMFKLRGHKDIVTDVKLLENTRRLISSSKDTFIKVWDLDTQHCTQTLVGHRSEVWSFDINKSETKMISGSVDSDLRVWDLSTGASSMKTESGAQSKDDETREDEIRFIGTLLREGKERIISIRFSEDNKYLACQPADKNVQIFHIADAQEIQKKIKRRVKRLKEKAEPGKDEEKVTEEQIEAAGQYQPSDEFQAKIIVHAASKVRSVDFLPTKGLPKGGKQQVLLSLYNNVIEVHTLNELDATKVSSSDTAGHRQDIRVVSISGDGNMALSASQGTLKIWNASTRQCMRTMECGYPLCAAFLPGDRHVVVGTKAGHLELFEIASSNMIESIEAHSNAIWSLDVHPNGKGIMTGGADREVKFWDFQLKETEDGGKNITLGYIKSLQMTDDVLCVKYSPDQKYFAVSLLDSTVKVFFTDTLRFFLSLYGHKLPVLTLDISSDSTLIATGSADKNIKIWGLDFGDCHKSLFAHNDNVMQLKFVPKTHYLFSVGKDKVLKYWDADKFENIMTLEGHHAEIWALAISKRGDFVVTGSHDRSLRFWKKTDEQLFLEEERDAEMDKMFEKSLAEASEKKTDAESASTGKKTMETVKAGEKILEAIELAEQEEKVKNEYEDMLAKHASNPKEFSKPAAPQPNPILLGKSGHEYLVNTLKQIPSADIEEALLTLPFDMAVKLLGFLDKFVEKKIQTELSSRCAIFLVKSHFNQVVHSDRLRTLLTSLWTHINTSAKEYRSIVGFNLAALQFLKRDIAAATNSNVFGETETKVQETKKLKFSS